MTAEGKKGLLKALIMVAVILLIFAVIVVIAILENRKFTAMPEQAVWTKVINKEERINYRPNSGRKQRRRFATFETSDGTKILLVLDRKNSERFYDFQEGDTGILTFKGPIDGDKYSDRLFVSFEKE